MVADGPIDVLDDEALRRVHGWLGLLARALSIEGFRSEALTMSLSMLEDALALPNVTREELIDVFRGISHSVRGIVRRRILDVYGDLFEDLGPIRVARGDFPIGEPGDGESVIRAGENFLRGLIAQSLALQRIDNVAGGMLQALSDPGREWVAGRRNAVDGEFEIVAGEKTAIIEPYQSVHYSADLPHAIRNKSRGPAVAYLAVRYQRS